MSNENSQKDEEISQKSSENTKIDAIDRQILNILHRNSRTKLVKIAKDVQLSVDSTRKRILKLENQLDLRYTMLLNDKKLGFNTGIHIDIKLKDIKKERYDDFISYMMKNPRVIVLMAVLGDYDIYTVMIAKDQIEMEEMKMKIRQDFSDLIGDWKEVIVAKPFKLEEYNF